MTAFGLKGWQWLYLIEGIPSVIFGVIAFFYLPDYPDKASWLSKDEKEWYNMQPVGQNHQKTLADMWQSIKAAFSDSKVLIMAAVVIVPNLVAYGVLLFLPLMIKAVTGWSSLYVGLVSVFPAIGGIVGRIVVGYSSDHFNERKFHTIIPTLWNIIFFSLFGLAYYFQFHALLVIFMLSVAVIGWAGLTAPLWAWVSNKLEGEINSAVAIAVVTTFGNVGAFIGPFIVGEIAGKDTENIGWISVFMVVGSLIFAITFFIVATNLDKKPRTMSNDEKVPLIE